MVSSPQDGHSIRVAVVIFQLCARLLSRLPLEILPFGQIAIFTPPRRQTIVTIAENVH
jgi:hypothetical protein